MSCFIDIKALTRCRIYYVRCDVLTAVAINSTTFWDLRARSLVEVKKYAAYFLLACLGCPSIPKTREVRFSEDPETYHITRRNIQDGTFQNPIRSKDDVRVW
jgi:hypothetical protein